MGSIIPLNNVEKCRVKVQSVPFRRNMPNAVRVNFMTFRQCHLEYKSSQQFRRKELSRLDYCTKSSIKSYQKVKVCILAECKCEELTVGPDDRAENDCI